MRIWKVSHGDIPSLTVDGRREKLLQKNLIAIGEPDGWGANSRYQSDSFREIARGDVVILSHGPLVLRICAGIRPVHPLRLGDLGGWLARKYEPIAEAKLPREYAGKQKNWLPNGRSACWEVPGAEWPGLERLILRPHFRRDIDWLKRRAAPFELGGNLGEPAEESREGRKHLRQHWHIERNPRLVKAKKARALQDGQLACEACGFIFETVYGPVGAGVIEVHHKIPLASLVRPRKVRISDLALLCANCHRMVHKRDPLFSIGEIKLLLRKHRH